MKQTAPTLGKNRIIRRFTRYVFEVEQNDSGEIGFAPGTSCLSDRLPSGNLVSSAALSLLNFS